MSACTLIVLLCLLYLDNEKRCQESYTMLCMHTLGTAYFNVKLGCCLGEVKS
jgi:hypothetical protein